MIVLSVPHLDPENRSIAIVSRNGLFKVGQKTGGYRSGQTGQTVNLLALPSQVRILLPPLFASWASLGFLLVQIPNGFALGLRRESVEIAICLSAQCEEIGGCRRIHIMDWDFFGSEFWF